MMTRKDYVRTADILSAYREQITAEAFADIVDDFAIMFAQDNSNFQRSRFVDACGLVRA